MTEQRHPEDLRLWYPSRTYRTPAWHSQSEVTKEPTLLYGVLHHEHDALGVETGKAHIMFWERWGEGGGYGRPSISMPVREALKAMAEIEAEFDQEYKRADDRAHGYYRKLSEEFHNAKPYREHPWQVAEAATRLETPLSASATLRFRAPQAVKTVPAQDTPSIQEDVPESTWRTTAFRGKAGYPAFDYLSFMELRPCPEPEKEGQYRLYTWRIGPDSTYCAFIETGLQRAREIMGYHDWQYPYYNCPEVKGNEGGGLCLPPEYFAAKDFRLHPTLNPDAPAVEELVARKNVTTLKPLRFKPKS